MSVMQQTLSRKAAYGSWLSPITSDLIVAESVILSEPLIDRDCVYWLEGRPNERGRTAIVQFDSNGQLSDLIDTRFNARSRVHEYGGGAYTVNQGTVYFSNSKKEISDQNLYRVSREGQPVELTHEPNLRYADLVIDEYRNELICIREDHRGRGEAVNEIVSVALDGSGRTQTLLSGNDFYSSPALNSHGNRLAWLTWNHPNLPWTSNQLWVADFINGAILRPQQIAGRLGESILQPKWSPDGTLYFISDREEWWNISRLRNQRIECVTPMAAEFGQAQWHFGMSTYAFISSEVIICAYTVRGIWKLATLDANTLQLTNINLPYQTISFVRALNNIIVFRGSSPISPAAIIQLDLSTQTTKILHQSTKDIKDLVPYLSIPKEIEFPTADGKTAYAFFYAPKNPNFEAPTDRLPPLIVKNHGGPTASASNSLDMRTQFWTSRGFAVLDVNYGGSTGYGREYRFRLEHNWGIVDLNDCVSAAEYLVKQRIVNGSTLAISGTSAGGFTTLCALTFRNVFSAGASHYGIGNLKSLATDVHKFESHYLEWLVGPYPDGAAEYEKRSPIEFVDKITVPVIFFQGSDDPIIPPAQAELMVDALRSRGIPFGYFLFAGEQHGFRRADSIKRALDAELYFYATHLLREGLRF